MALRAFSASCAASHEPFAAVASSRASKFTVTFGILVSAIAIWIELTISTVCVRDAPVMGRLEMILTVLAVDAPVVPPVPPPPHAPITSARAVMAAAAAVHRLCMQTLLLSGLIGIMARPWRAASLRRQPRNRASLASRAPCVNEDQRAPLLGSGDASPRYRCPRSPVHSRRMLCPAPAGLAPDPAVDHAPGSGPRRPFHGESPL